jgi:hypothetical protein
MALSRLHDIKESSTRFFGDFLDPATAIRPDPQRPSNFMEGHADIVTGFNRYKISFYSPHGAQPAGAPTECRSLGSVELVDPATDTRILGPRSDQTFINIAKHLGVREFTDRIAVARRELAEAAPDAVKPLQEKLGALVSAAGKWGVSGSVPMAPKPAMTVAPAAAVEAASHVPSAPAIAPAPVPMPPVALDGSEPFVGAHVLFVTNPGERVSGMQELPAIIVRVHPNRNHVSLLVFIDDSETVHRLNIPRRGSDAGGGRIHQYGVWDFNPSWLRDQERLRQLEQSLGAIEALAVENKQLADRLAALEAAAAKPRRGRPAKPDGGSEAEAGELPAEGEASASALPAQEPDLLG